MGDGGWVGDWKARLFWLVVRNRRSRSNVCGSFNVGEGKAALVLIWH
jgi:hypothetical protein